jgi:hypothetical protein
MLFSNVPTFLPRPRDGSASPAPAHSAPPSVPRHLRVAMLLACAATLSACCCEPDPAATAAPAAIVDPLTPVVPIDLTALTGVEAAGVGGDSAGDGGADGSAGDGAPLKRAVVTLTDAKGNSVNGLTDNNGKFLLKYKTSVFTAPLVLRVIGVGGSVLSSVADEVAVSGKTIRANINPLTDKITSDVLPASVAGTDKVFDGSKVDLTKLAQAKANLVASVRDALITAGVTDTRRFDPVKSAYAYDGTGVDAVIESISHARDPATGATQLRAKLAGVQNNADGSVVPVLITASTPLATTQVALASNPALTFEKITNWVSFINSCLAVPAPGSVDCQDDDGSRIVSNGYKQNSKSFDADFSTLLSETGKLHVQGSSLRNPSILFFTRAAGSTIDDRAVVEVTINQPRTGPLAGNSTTPIEYTKVLVFKRDDALTRAKAGNWILWGNQRNFDWSVDPSYLAQTQTNPIRQANAAGGTPSSMRSGVIMNFNSLVYNTSTASFTPVNVYAVRLKGPGLPTPGLVYVPTSTTNGTTSTAFSILNKTGTIPAQGSVSLNAQRTFGMSGALLGTGAALDPSVWNGAAVNSADTLTSTDLTALQAYSSYQAEIYVNGSLSPIVETARILAPVQSAAIMSKIPQHDLQTTNNLSYITPPVAATSTVTVNWNRVSGATRIDNATTFFFAGTSLTSVGASVPDALSLVPTSTSVTISNGAIGFPAGAITDYRSVTISGRSARALFQSQLIRSP